jgi:hypothetical protein
LLQHTYRWLRANLSAEPHLSTAIPATVTAVHLFEARQIPACLYQIRTVVTGLRQASAVSSPLPPL